MAGGGHGHAGRAERPGSASTGKRRHTGGPAAGAGGLLPGRRSPSSHGGPEPAGGTAGVPPPACPWGLLLRGPGGSPGVEHGLAWDRGGPEQGWAQPGGEEAAAGLCGDGGGTELQGCGSVFFPVPPSSRASSPLRLAGCVLRPVPRTGSLTHQTLLPPHQGNFCIFLRIPAWQGLLHPPGQGPSRGHGQGRGRGPSSGTSFLATPSHCGREGKAPGGGVRGCSRPLRRKPEPDRLVRGCRGGLLAPEAPGTRCRPA